MLVLGIGFLSGARSALLYHTTIYFKGWMYPWQAIIGGSRTRTFPHHSRALPEEKAIGRKLNVYATRCI